MTMVCRSKGSKYGNRKVVRNGITYDSKKEADRHAVLKLMERSGKIRDLKRQVKFELIPSLRDEKTGRVVERSCSYVADFTYWEGQNFVVEDTKGFRTPDYILKRKLMLYLHGIRIKET